MKRNQKENKKYMCHYIFVFSFTQCAVTNKTIVIVYTPATQPPLCMEDTAKMKSVICSVAVEEHLMYVA